MREYASLRRIRLHIIELLEIRRIFEVPKSGHPVAFVAVPGADTARQRRNQPGSSERQRRAPRNVRPFAHREVPVLAARSESHHQTVGKAGSAYLGNGSGRAKRSQRAVRAFLMVNCGTT